MEWATKRRLLYGTVTVVFTLALSAFVVTQYIIPNPTCFDSKKNGFEVGIDCGGTCALKCSSEIIPLSVIWARTLPVGTSTYDVVGLIENKNINNAPRDVPYRFTVFNKNGDQLFARNGTTTIAVEDELPIIIQNVSLTDVPYKTVLTLLPTLHYVKEERTQTPPIKTVRTKQEDGDIPRVYLTVKNTEQLTFSNLPVRIILYDNNNNAIGVGETFISFLDKEEQEELVFTWKQPFTDPVSRIGVYYELPSSH